MKTIKNIFSVVASALCLSACALFQKDGAAVANDVGQLAACVIAHAETDTAPTFESIAAECSGIAVTDVVTIVTALGSSGDAASEATIAKYRRIGHAVNK